MVISLMNQVNFEICEGFMSMESYMVEERILTYMVYIFILGGFHLGTCAVSSLSKKKQEIFFSSTKTDYKVAMMVSCEIVWLKGL